jgi:type I restriction enzyme S subunit
MVRPGYKQTEVGEIPEDWDVSSLRSCLKSNPKYGINAAAVPLSGDLPAYLRITDISEDGRFKPSPVVGVNHKESTNYYLKRGDLVFARTGASVGKCYKYRQEDGALVYAGFLIKISPNEIKLVPDFLFQYVNANRYWQWITLMSMRSGQPGVNGNEYGQLPVPLPSPTEQKAIAKALSDVDELIVSLEKLIAKKRDIKTATMQQLLTGKKRLPGFGEGKGTKQTELGEIPEDWGIAEVGKLLSITTGDKNTQDKVEDGKYPFFVRSQKIEKINSYSFEGEGVLTAGDGVGTGKIFHYINGRFDYHQRVYLMHEFTERLNGKYFYIYFSNHFYDRIMSMTAKSSVDSVRREMISRMPMIIPSIEEQEAIGQILFDMDSELDLLGTRLNKTKAVKQGMMQELLTGRTRLVDVAETKKTKAA